MTATEAARSFSDVLNRAASGEEIELTRSGAPVAIIGPPQVRLVSAERFRELLAGAPSPDPAFGEDLRAIRESAGPASDPWAS
jgi:antitoxin (DNA-binding transcriptional repressor) of toxin-antitoxin stability system